MYYIYVLKSKNDGSLYLGYTDNLRRRFREHNQGKGLATKNKLPWEIVYYECYKSRSDAKYRENNLKRFAQMYTQIKKRIKNSLK